LIPSAPTIAAFDPLQTTIGNEFVAWRARPGALPDQLAFAGLGLKDIGASNSAG
jgi:hypothetical protein